MSPRAGSGALRLLGTLVALLLSGVAFWACAGGGASGATPRSALSPEDEGRLAAYATLAELGYPVELWNGAPGELEGEDLLFLSEPPPVPAALLEDGTPPLPGRARSGGVDASARDPKHYRRFAELGGTLVVALGRDNREELVEDERTAFLHESLGLPEVRELRRVDRGVRRLEFDGPTVGLGTGAAHGLVFSGAEDLPEDLPGDLEALGARALASWAPGSPFEDGAVWAAEFELGRGRVVVLADDLLFENKALQRRSAGARALVRLVEALRPRGRVLFDEYALGSWRPPGKLALAASPIALPLSLGLGLLLLLAVWRLAWPREFPRDAEPVSSLSPLARAEGEAALLARAGQWSTLTHLLAGGVLQRLALRLGLRNLAGRVERREPAPEEVVRGVADALASQTGRAEDAQRLREVFARRPAKNARELEQWAAALGELEGRG